MGVFGVFRDTMILWTALIWRCVFHTSLGFNRIMAISVVFTGLAVNRVGGLTWSWTFLWVLLMTLTNSLASVANEFALKRSKSIDINVQNAVLYTGCSLFAILLLAVDDPMRLAGPSAFFQGFNASTMVTVSLQAFAGLVVSRLLKYADSVTKTVACCLRGPVVVFLAPYILGTPSSWSELLSAFVVASGCTMYLLCGPLATSAQEKEPGPKLISGEGPTRGSEARRLPAGMKAW